MWEVFVRNRRGLAHTHVGSVVAADERMALRYGRDVFTRRGNTVSIWVARSSSISASQPDEKGCFFDPATDKTYRHAASYEVPDGVKQL